MDNNQNEEPTIGSNVNQQPVINPPVGQPQLNDSSNSLVASQAPPAPFEQVQPEQALTIEPQINNDSSNNIIQTTTVNSAEKPKKNKKLTIIIIAVVLILLFAVGVIIYLLASGKSPSEDISVDTYSAETLSKTFDPEAPIPIK